MCFQDLPVGHLFEYRKFGRLYLKINQITAVVVPQGFIRQDNSVRIVSAVRRVTDLGVFIWMADSEEPHKIRVRSAKNPMGRTYFIEPKKS